jgi:hypothetical protein
MANANLSARLITSTAFHKAAKNTFDLAMHGMATTPKMKQLKSRGAGAK